MLEPEQPKPPVKLPWAVKIFQAILILGAIVVILLAAYWVYATFLSTERIVSNPKERQGVGERLAFLELQPLTGPGTQVSLKDLSGSVVLLNFWGTWCPPCRNELPHIAELGRRYAGRIDFRLLAVSYPPGGASDDAESLQEETASLLKRLRLDLPTYRDPGDRTLAATDHAIVFEGFPTSVLLDRQGLIRAVWVGYLPGMEIDVEREIGAVLDEK
jgi:thiol-disulfide isomerase/thioredoxin